MKKIKWHQWEFDNGFQTWVKRVYFYDDYQLELLGNWSVGLYHCENCGATQGFAFHLPKDIPVDGIPEAHNSWFDFLLAHSHGDGRVILFEKKIPEIPHSPDIRKVGYSANSEERVNGHTK